MDNLLPQAIGVAALMSDEDFKLKGVKNGCMEDLSLGRVRTPQHARSKKGKLDRDVNRPESPRDSQAAS